MIKLLILIFVNLFLAPERCLPVPVDIGFLVDVSGDVKNSDLKSEFGFLKFAAQYFWLSNLYAHLALMMYGQTAGISIKFNNFYSVRAFNFALDKIVPENGAASLDKGLQVAAEQLSTSSVVVLPGVPT